MVLKDWHDELRSGERAKTPETSRRRLKLKQKNEWRSWGRKLKDVLDDLGCKPLDMIKMSHDARSHEKTANVKLIQKDQKERKRLH